MWGRLSCTSIAAVPVDSSTHTPPTTGSRSRVPGRQRCNQSSRQTTTQREGMALQEVQHGIGCTTVAHLDMIPQNGKAKYRHEVNNSTNGHRYEVPRLSYEDTKQIMERRLAQQKRGILTKSEINHIVKDWGDQRAEENLDKTAIK